MVATPHRLLAVATFLARLEWGKSLLRQPTSRRYPHPDPAALQPAADIRTTPLDRVRRLSAALSRTSPQSAVSPPRSTIASSLSHRRRRRPSAGSSPRRCAQYAVPPYLEAAEYSFISPASWNSPQEGNLSRPPANSLSSRSILLLAPPSPLRRLAGDTELARPMPTPPCDRSAENTAIIPFASNSVWLGHLLRPLTNGASASWISASLHITCRRRTFTPTFAPQ